MPQADIIAFAPTLLLLPVGYLVGYAWFVGYWVPRVVVTLKARAWVTRSAVVVFTSDEWPEIFLMGVQFGALVWLVSRITLVPVGTVLPTRVGHSGRTVTYTAVAGQVENFFTLWVTARATYLFAPSSAVLTRTVRSALASFVVSLPGRQFSRLADRLKSLPPGELIDLPE